ncbi:MAG: class II aldolase/adducin family protein [Candidatus Marinimicrobia bacterium]|nr:class II aldolase/adducin family protein [Candidatus Neomarinimicrobiota bacterium]
MDEGYIKFHCELEDDEAPDVIFTSKLNTWRTTLHKHQLIGEYDDGIGYGNVSRRFIADSFIISGSATGSNATLDFAEYVLVTGFNIRTNTVSAKGLIPPSSESLTHGIIYKTLPQVKWVLHIHNATIWKYYKNILPTTAEHIPYGTPEMALEVMRLILASAPTSPRILIMGGHQDGIIAYGINLDDVGQKLLNLVVPE